MANQMSNVVGVFLDDSWAQRALKALQGAGFQARMADENAVNSLTDSGIDSNAAGLYKSRYGEGNSVIVVDNAGNRGEDALGIMLQNGAENIDMSKNMGGSATGSTSGSTTTTTTTSNTGNTGNTGAYDADYYKRMQNTDVNSRQYGQHNQDMGRAQTADEMRVQLREETLTPVKQNVQAGEVQLQKVVHEKQEQVPVTLRHEEVIIERTPVDRPANAGDIGDMTDQVISVPVYEEQAELQKQARVREEVNIGKRTEERQETLSGTARHEHLEVTQQGDVQVTGDTQGMTERDTTGNSGSNSSMPAYDTTADSGNNPKNTGRNS